MSIIVQDCRNVIIDGVNAGSLVDALQNYKSRSLEIMQACDAYDAAKTAEIRDITQERDILGTATEAKEIIKQRKVASLQAEITDKQREIESLTRPVTPRNNPS